MNDLKKPSTEGKSLTKKQAQYVSLVASGLTTEEIADDCLVSTHTVRNTIVKAKERVDASSTANLVATSVQEKWIIPLNETIPYEFIPNE